MVDACCVPVAVSASVASGITSNDLFVYSFVILIVFSLNLVNLDVLVGSGGSECSNANLNSESSVVNYVLGIFSGVRASPDSCFHVGGHPPPHTHTSPP